jgi:hypothetical protein
MEQGNLETSRLSPATVWRVDKFCYYNLYLFFPVLQAIIVLIKKAAILCCPNYK